MATVTGLTAERMLEIEDASVVGGTIVDGDLILTKHDGSQINAGPVLGPPGPMGPEGSAAIPGEVKLWPGDVLPAEATYGKWVWADGQDYKTDDHPKAAAHISAAWRQFDGASNPAADRFRVPDLRGLVAAGLDQMPSPSIRGRAGRMTRAVAIQLAKKAGKEEHKIELTEVPSHAHGGGNHLHVDSGHDHPPYPNTGGGMYVATRNSFTGVHSEALEWVGPEGFYDLWYAPKSGIGQAAIQYSGAIIAPEGGNGAHENVQPTVFVPYIVYLDVV